jgi:hypothetical protein
MAASDEVGVLPHLDKTLLMQRTVDTTTVVKCEDPIKPLDCALSTLV